jgi:hypothetical protein
MIQSIRSIVAALRVGKGKGAMMLAGVVVLPTIAEFVMNHAVMLWGDIDPDTGKPRAYFDGSRFWTAHEWYWNGMNEKQRVGNAHVAIPGVAPWRWPSMNISPEWSVGRGVTMDIMESLTSASDVGNRSMIEERGGQTFASFARQFDIPLPPLGAALLSLGGVDMRLGVQEVTDPESGTSFKIYNAKPIGTGQKYGPFAQQKYANSVHDEKVANIIQDILGAAGSAYLAISEAFFAGNQKGGVFDGAEDAVQAVGDQVTRQFRPGAPLFGRAIHTNKDNTINKQLFAKRSAIRHLTRTVVPHQLGQGVIDMSTGRRIESDTMPVAQDPVYIHIADAAYAIQGTLDAMQVEVNHLQKALFEAGNNPDQTYAERVKTIDELNTRINSSRAKQLRAIEAWEQKVSDMLSERLGRRVQVDFDEAGSEKRPNVGDFPVLPVPPTGAPQFTPRPSGQ